MRTEVHTIFLFINKLYTLSTQKTFPQDFLEIPELNITLYIINNVMLILNNVMLIFKTCTDKHIVLVNKFSFTTVCLEIDTGYINYYAYSIEETFSQDSESCSKYFSSLLSILFSTINIFKKLNSSLPLWCRQV